MAMRRKERELDGEDGEARWRGVLRAAWWRRWSAPAGGSSRGGAGELGGTGGRPGGAAETPGGGARWGAPGQLVPGGGGRGPALGLTGRRRREAPRGTGGGLLLAAAMCPVGGGHGPAAEVLMD